MELHKGKLAFFLCATNFFLQSKHSKGKSLPQHITISIEVPQSLIDLKKLNIKEILASQKWKFFIKLIQNWAKANSTSSGNCQSFWLLLVCLLTITIGPFLFRLSWNTTDQLKTWTVKNTFFSFFININNI